MVTSNCVEEHSSVESLNLISQAITWYCDICCRTYTHIMLTLGDYLRWIVIDTVTQKMSLCAVEPRRLVPPVPGTFAFTFSTKRDSCGDAHSSMMIGVCITSEYHTLNHSNPHFNIKLSL